MRWAMLRTEGGPRLHGLHDGSYVDLNATDPSFPADLRELLAAGPEALARAEEVLRAGSGPIRVAPDRAAFAPPILQPEKIVCLGLNYREHAGEIRADAPAEPILFAKYANTLVGHGEPIRLPAISAEVDYEAELVVVIGAIAKDVPESDALNHVAGYTVGHDVSARDWQLHKPGRQWLAGKSFDTFAPTGPDLVTADEVGDPQELGVSLTLNGEVMQDARTSLMIFDVAYTIAYISRLMTLRPGDLIFTGTPSGVGMARTPPVWLRPEDRVTITIERVGTLSNPVIQG